MGRYAEFITGFSYKFAFGVQDSLDITEFYGAWRKNMEEYENSISWTAEEDKEMIFEKLERMQKENIMLPVVQFELYKPSMQGTHDLREFFCEKELKLMFASNDAAKNFYKYILGCFIYHQLTYTEDLSCDFEL